MDEDGSNEYIFPEDTLGNGNCNYIYNEKFYKDELEKFMFVDFPFFVNLTLINTIQLFGEHIISLYANYNMVTVCDVLL